MHFLKSLYLQVLLGVFSIWMIIVPGYSIAHSLFLQENEKSQQTEAQTKKKKKVRTFTNKDIERIKEEKNVSVSTAPTTGTTTPRRNAQSSGKAGKEAFLNKYRSYKQKEKATKDRIATLEKEIRILTTGLMGSDWPDQTQKIRDRIASKQEELKKLRKELADIQRTLSQLRREASQHGIYPGVLRKVDREFRKP